MIGTKLAHYEITALVGRGGMGEVYRARDTRLGRDVALKLLPPEFTQDRERVARFRREARTLATLNHPHVAAIHDIGEADGKVFLTMELVEGQDLSERLREGPLSVERVIDYATQLADGLQEAHDKGIVHRDLKPANVKVTSDGQLKILDFGLARAWHGEEEGEQDPHNSPTITAAMTHEGMILGTAAYMSPEQARGRPVDRRADIWAFGAIVWEMLTAKQLFAGESISDTLAAVLRAEPDGADLPDETPARLRQLLRLCLERDRRRRLQHIGDAQIFLEGSGVEAAPAQGATEGPSFWRWAALALLVVSIGLGVLALRPSGDDGDGRSVEVRRWSFAPADRSAANYTPVVSPDGRRVAYVDEGRLWIRDVEQLRPRSLEGARNATIPFWSSDGRWLGYVADRRLWRVSPGGGEPTPIGAIQSTSQVGNAAAVVWDGQGRLVIGTAVSGLLHVPTSGAASEVFLPTSEGEVDFHEVTGIPGDRGWVFVVHKSDGSYGRLDLLTPEGDRRTLLDLEDSNVGDPWVSEAGHLLFQRDGFNEGVWAARFSLETLEVTGDPFLVAAEGTRPSVSRDGTLVYQLGGGVLPGELVWIDREGRVLDVLAEVETNRPFPKLSPDGRDLLMCIREDDGLNIWSFDVASGQGRRLDSTERGEELAVRSPGEDFVYFYAAGDLGFGIYRFPNNVFSETERLADGIMPHPRPDLGGLFYASQKPNSFDFDIAFLPLDEAGTGEPRTLVESPAIDWMPVVSPDGRFLAYTSNESGQYEIYLTDLPQARQRWKVSSDGGEWARWNGDGNEIFYAEDDAIYSVGFDATAGVRLGVPQKLFAYESTKWSDEWDSGFDVDPSGQRFVVVRRQPNSDVETAQIVVVENWTAEFSRD